jgi:acyl carrier protein
LIVDSAAIEETVIDYLVSAGGAGLTKDELQPDDSLLDKGLLDSVGVLKLVVFIEQNFDVAVEDDEVVPENFQTVREIAAYVRRKLDAKTSTGE